MTLVPTLIVYGRHARRPLGWYVDVERYGEETVLHYHLLKGDRYLQHCGDDIAFKFDQAAHMARTGHVVISYDDTSVRPWKRLGYWGLFRAHEPRLTGRNLTFRLGDKLAGLMKPSEFRRRW